MAPELVFEICLEGEQRNVQRCRCKALPTHLPILFEIFCTIGVLNTREENLFGRRGSFRDEQGQANAQDDT